MSLKMMGLSILLTNFVLVINFIMIYRILKHMRREIFEITLDVKNRYLDIQTAQRPPTDRDTDYFIGCIWHDRSSIDDKGLMESYLYMIGRWVKIGRHPQYR